MDAGITMSAVSLRFQLNRWDLFNIVRLAASGRPFRRVAMPALAGFVFLGHAVDRNYIKGAAWACLVTALYWGGSHLMFLLHVYAGGNETLLVPQEISLYDDRMVVESEHSREEFPKPRPEEVKVSGNYLILSREGEERLIFVRRSFESEAGFEQLGNWMRSRT